MPLSSAKLENLDKLGSQRRSGKKVRESEKVEKGMGVVAWGNVCIPSNFVAIVIPTSEV